jgi:hypothetical protein
MSGALISTYSVGPSGERFPLPGPEDDARERQRLETAVQAACARGKEIVVVMGVGFVGAVMAAIVADSVQPDGKPGKFVIGCRRPRTRSYWRIPLLARGESPVKAEDPDVAPMIQRVVRDKQTLIATHHNDCLRLADCVVVDVQCDYSKPHLGGMRTGIAEMSALEATMRTIGERIPPSCLVLIETTVAPGNTEFVAWPILRRAFAERGLRSEPLLAHSFERVMPGREYVRSIRDFWRVCSGCTPEAKARTAKFLGEVLNIRDFPLTVMDRPIESETTKIVENSYRATIQGGGPREEAPGGGDLTDESAMWKRSVTTTWQPARSTARSKGPGRSSTRCSSGSVSRERSDAGSPAGRHTHDAPSSIMANQGCTGSCVYETGGSGTMTRRWDRPPSGSACRTQVKKEATHEARVDAGGGGVGGGSRSGPRIGGSEQVGTWPGDVDHRRHHHGHGQGRRNDLQGRTRNGVDRPRGGHGVPCSGDARQARPEDR